MRSFYLATLVALVLLSGHLQAQPAGGVDERIVRGFATGLDSPSPEIQRFALSFLGTLAEGDGAEMADQTALQLLDAGVLERIEALVGNSPDAGVRQAASKLRLKLEHDLGLANMEEAPQVTLSAIGAHEEVELVERVEWFSLATPGPESVYELRFGSSEDPLSLCLLQVAVLGLGDRTLIDSGEVSTGESFPIRAHRDVAVRLARQAECDSSEGMRVEVRLRQRPKPVTATASVVEAPALDAGRYLLELSGPSAAAWFRVSGELGRFYVVETSQLSSGFDSVLAVYDAAGKSLLREDDDGGVAPLSSRLVLRAGPEPLPIRLTTLRDGGVCEVEVSAIGELLPLDGGVSGELTPGTNAYHVVTMQPGYRYSLSGSGDFDGVLTLLGPDGEELAWNDDYEGRNPRIDWIPREDTSYLVELSALSGGGPYELRATRTELGDVLLPGAEPAAIQPGGEYPGFLDPDQTQELTFTAIADTRYQIAASGSRGFDSRLTLLDEQGLELEANDDYGGGRDARIEWTAPADGTYRIELREYGDRGGDYTISLREMGTAIAISPTGRREKASVVEVGSEVTGQLESAQPQWLRFAAEAGRAYRVEAYAEPLDARLWLYSESTGDDLLAYNDDREPGDLEPRVEWYSETDANVDLMLDERDGSPGEFRIAVSEIEPSDELRERSSRRPFDGHDLGDPVRLGRHQPIDGDDNWDPEMQQYVGRTAVIRELIGQEGDTGAYIVRVDVDNGKWVWRTADMRPADDEESDAAPPSP